MQHIIKMHVFSYFICIYVYIVYSLIVQIVPPLYLLQTLVIFSQEQNLVRTAQRLGLTQPTVSRQLQQLEESFENPLFRTEGRNKVLTEYGLHLVQKLSDRFADLEVTFNQVNQEFQKPNQLRLTIAGRSELLGRLFAGVSFDGNMDFQLMSGQETSDRIANHKVDLGITQKKIQTADYISKKIWTDEPVLIVPKKWIGSEDLKFWQQNCFKHPACAYSSESPLLGDFLTLAKDPQNISIHWIMSDWTNLEKRVAEGLSWTILPNSYAQDRKSYRVIQLPKSFQESEFYLYYRKDLTKFPWFKELLSQLL